MGGTGGRDRWAGQVGGTGRVQVRGDRMGAGETGEW